ncbi:MAG: 2-dehydropantoate 2-reductase [Burkholderiales bacterium]|nr:2-dehydropantoate 2-reductase [Burkholderiales bacterium]
MGASTMNSAQPVVAVVGAGAVGCYYGGMLARAGAAVTLIGRPAHVEAIRQGGLVFEARGRTERVAVAAETQIAAAAGAQLVLFCVKSTDTDAAAAALAPHLAGDALVLALQNGVDNPPRIAARVAVPVVPAVVYVACHMAGPGHVRHTGRGDLVIGALRGAAHAAGSARLASLAATLDAAGIPCRVSANVEGELWGKLLINCTYNAISALGRAQYKRLTALPESRELMAAVVREVLAVAAAEGVVMPPGDWVETALALSQSMPEATSSTAQDIARGKRTEIDHLNGYVAACGAARGVPTPVNRALFALVKLVEDGLP